MELIGEGLACERGGRRVFEMLSFRLPEGALLVLRGPNGSGKTSLIRMIAGLIEPAAGRLALEGADADLSIGQQCHLVAHQEALKPALTVAENLAFWRDFLGGGDVAMALESFDLTRLSAFQAALLSAGQKRRLSLSRLALIARSIWLLDEPTVGLDQASQVRLQALMRAHLDSGGLIVAATHVGLGLDGERVLDFGSLGMAA